MKYLSHFHLLPKHVRLDLIEELSKDNNTNKYTHYIGRSLHIPEDSLIGLPLSKDAVVRFSIRGHSLEVRILDINHPQVKEALECLKELQQTLETIINNFVLDYNLDKHLATNLITKLDVGSPALTHELIKPVFTSNSLDDIRGLVPRIRREARIMVDEEKLIKLAEWYNGGALLKFNK